jgi:hypothetical protein
MSVLRMRQFLLGLYHDLPNVLFVGSLVLGSITGYLPLVWVSMGLIMNAFTVGSVQQLFDLLLDKQKPWSQVFLPKGSACDVISTPSTGLTIIAPSYWLSSAIFFATFIIYNSVQVALIPVANGASQEKADVRQAFTLTTIVIGMVFFLLVLMRGYSGCESYLGGALGSLLGVGLGIGFWHLLNVCGAGMVPDILQVVNSMAPPGEDTVPVVCSA